MTAAKLVWRRLVMDWPALLHEELVTGRVEDYIGKMEGVALARPSARALPNLQDQLAQSLRLPLAKAQGIFDASVSASFLRITEQAARKGWTMERYRAAIERFTLLAGARFEGSWIETWHRTLVLESVYQQAILERFSANPTSNLYPYLIYKTAADDVVRPAHEQLNNFIARSAWNGWTVILPPNDWNCRCKVQAIGVLVARAIGLSGDFPFGSDKKILNWPGPSPKFPKALRPALGSA